MRQLKTFMRNRKKEMLACGPCECRTLQCWRYANENCGCGESNLPNYVKVLKDEIGVYWVHFFNDIERYNTISIETDYEAGGIKTVVGEFPIIKNEDTRGLWYQVWDNIDAEVVEKLFGIDKGKEGVGQFTPEAMAQFNALINNPTEEQADSLKEWLENKAADESPIVIFDLPNYVEVEGDTTYGGYIQFFNEYDSDEQGNNISIEIDTEEGGWMLSVGEFGIIGDENAKTLWRNIWESLAQEAVAKLFGMDEGNTGVGHFTSEAMAQFNAFVKNPTEGQTQILREWLEDKASDEYDPPHYPIVVFDFSIIRGDLTSLDADELAEQISTAAEDGVFELLINGNTYTFEPVSEESCDVYVNINGIEYSTGVSIEIDDETGKRIVVVGEIQERE